MSFKNKVNISVLISLLSVILLLFVIGVYAQDNDTVITNSTDINTTVNNTNNGVREVYVHNVGQLKWAVDDLTRRPCEKLVIILEDGDYKMNTGQIEIQSGQNIEINGNGHMITAYIEDGKECPSFQGISNSGNLTINNLQFKKISVENQGTLTVHGSTFKNNQVSHASGGAIWNSGTLTVTDSAFRNNKVDYDGGAIYSIAGKVNHIKNCTFENNIANSALEGRCEGGAIKCTGNNNPLIVTDCNFIGNRAEDGGAIDARVLQISNCVFIGNKASNSDLACDGGAINCNDLNECHDCNFTGNTADNGGAIAIMEKAGINHIKDCIFKDNKATALKGGVNGKGGAIFVNRQAAHISLVHNQFINNYATNKADTVFNWGTYDKIEYNYFPNKDQNYFRDETGLKHKYIQDQHPFYNLEDYYKWKG